MNKHMLPQSFNTDISNPRRQVRDYIDRVLSALPGSDRMTIGHAHRFVCEEITRQNAERQQLGAPHLPIPSRRYLASVLRLRSGAALENHYDSASAGDAPAPGNSVRLTEHSLTLEHFLFAPTNKSLTPDDRRELRKAVTGFSVYISTHMPSGMILGIRVGPAGNVRTAALLIGDTLMGSLARDVDAKADWNWRFAPDVFSFDPEGVFAGRGVTSLIAELGTEMAATRTGDDDVCAELVWEALRRELPHGIPQTFLSANDLYLGLREGRTACADTLRGMLGRWACEVHNFGATADGCDRHWVFVSGLTKTKTCSHPDALVRCLFGDRFCRAVDDHGAVVLEVPYDSPLLRRMVDRTDRSTVLVMVRDEDISVASVLVDRVWITVRNTIGIPPGTTRRAFAESTMLYGTPLPFEDDESPAQHG